MKSIGKDMKSPSLGYDYSLCNGLTHHRATLMQIFTIKGSRQLINCHLNSIDMQFRLISHCLQRFQSFNHFLVDFNGLSIHSLTGFYLIEQV